MNIQVTCQCDHDPEDSPLHPSVNPVRHALAAELGVSENRIRRWKHRDDGVADGCHTPHRLQTTLTPALVVVELRKTLLLPLDDLLVEFIHSEVSRSGLDRCLRRHGVSNLKALTPQKVSIIWRDLTSAR